MISHIYCCCTSGSPVSTPFIVDFQTDLLQLRVQTKQQYEHLRGIVRNVLL